MVVPAYNEADKIARTIASIPAFVDHVVVVDDGSQDGTRDIASQSVRSGLEVIGHERNRGVGAAITTGYARGHELGADATVVMAGDSQMDPADLPGLLEPLLSGHADYAKGNRFLWPRGWREMPVPRLLGNVVLSFLTRWATGLGDVFDSQCGYTAANRVALAAILEGPMFPRYGYPNHVLAQLGASALRVKDVPVRPVYGPDWRSGLSIPRVVLPLLALLTRAAGARVRRSFLPGRGRSTELSS